MRMRQWVLAGHFAAALLALAAIAAPARAARTLISPRPIDRPYPTYAGVVIGSFRPACSQVTIHVARCSDLQLGGCYGFGGGGTFDVLCVADSASVANHLTTGLQGFSGGCNADDEGQNRNTQNYDQTNRSFPVHWQASSRGWRLHGQAQWNSGIRLAHYGDSATIVVTGLTLGQAYTLYGTTSPYDPLSSGSVCTNLTAWVTEDSSIVEHDWSTSASSALPVSLASRAFTLAASPQGGVFVRWSDGDSARTARVDADGAASVFDRWVGSATHGLTKPDGWASVTDAQGNELRLCGEYGAGFGGAFLSARKSDGAGNALAGWPDRGDPPRTLVDLTGDQEAPAATATSDGGAIVAWTDTRNGAYSRNWRDVLTAASTDDYQLLRVDLQNDGRDELLSVRIAEDRIVAFARQGDALAPIDTFPTSHTPVIARTADLNADGRPDIVVSCANSDSLDVYLSTGAPGVYARGAITGAAGASDLVLADLSGDGLPDVAHVRPHAPAMAVRLGLGGGAFGPAIAYAAPVEPEFIAAGDLDGDGRTDLAVLGYTTPQGIVRAYRNLGGGVFAAAGDRSVEPSAHGLVIGKFAGDSRDDVAVPPGLNGPSTTLRIFAGSAGGDILSGGVANISLAAHPYTLVTDDIDQDGFADLVAPYSPDGTAPAQVLWGSAAGVGAPVSLPASLRSRWAAAVDLDGDGARELVLSDTGPVSPYWSTLHVHQRVRRGRDVYALRVTPGGAPAPGWTATGLAVATDTMDVEHIRIVGDGQDGAYVAWESFPPSDPSGWLVFPRKVRVQHVLANGELDPNWPDSSYGGVWPGGSVPQHLTDQVPMPNAPDGLGGVVLGYWADNPNEVRRAYARRVTDASEVTPLLQASGGARPRLGAWPDADVQAAWQGLAGSFSTLRLSPEGVPRPGWPSNGTILTSSLDTGAIEENGALCITDSAHVVFAWRDSGRVRVRRLGAGGTTGSWPAPITALSAASSQEQLVAGRRGETFLAARGADQIVVQRIDATGAVGDMSPEIALAADRRPDQGGVVRVSWLPSPLERSTPFRNEGGTYRLYTVAPSGARTLVSVQTAGEGCAYWADVAIPGVVPANFTEFGPKPRTVFELETLNPTTGDVLVAPRDSAFSVDDLPPPAPTAFSSAFTATGAGTGITEFDWTPTPVGDLAEYRIFGSPDSLFWSHVTTTPAPASHASAPTPAGRRFFRLYAADIHGNTSAPASPVFQLDAPDSGAPLTLSFAPPSPSPARTSTHMRLSLPSRASIELAAFDLLGRRVRRIAGGERAPGVYDVSWDLRDDEGLSLAPGLYLVRLRTGGREFRHRVLVVR